MRVLITGALGFIGSHLAETYLAEGHEVVGLDDRSGNVVDRVDGMVCIHWDARRVRYLRQHFDLVVHAASPVGAVALLERGSIVTEIVETTQAVIRYCEATGARLINISSSEVYGFSGVYRETDDVRIPHKLSHRIQYAAGKLAGEHLVRTSGTKNLSIRPFNVAGPRQTSAKGFVLPTFCEQAAVGQPLTVFGDGFQERSFTGVWDVCDFIAACDPVAHSGEVVNVGNPDNRTTVLDLAQRVIDTVGIGEYTFTSGKAVHGPDYEEAVGVVKVPDITAARRMGWQPKVGLDEMIGRTFADIDARQGVAHGE